MNIFVVHASPDLTDHRPHGDGLVAWGFVRALAARGHNLWVAAPQIDVRETNIENVTLFELACSSRNTVVRAMNYMVRVRLLYERLSKSVTFDVVHQLNPVVRGYSLAMIGTRPPLVLGPFVGDWPAAAIKGNWWDRARASAIKAARVSVDVLAQRPARALLLTTPYALNRTPGVDLSSPRVHLVPHGIDTDEFAPYAREGDPTMRPSSILFVRKARHKGVFTMLEAFNRIAAANPEARLIVAGDGPVTTEVEEVVARSVFKDRIDLVGKVGREEMPGLIRTASIVCAPSFGEPFGMIVLEAMSTGKPVAATRAGGIPYLLERSGGLLVEPGDASGLAEVLDRLLRDPALADSTGNSNREIAVSQYAWDRVAQGVERAYAMASSNA